MLIKRRSQRIAERLQQTVIPNEIELHPPIQRAHVLLDELLLQRFGKALGIDSIDLESSLRQSRLTQNLQGADETNRGFFISFFNLGAALRIREKIEKKFRLDLLRSHHQFFEKRKILLQPRHDLLIPA